MKVRHGFVSNSSSSSFIVAFDRKPKTVEELRTMMFGDRKTYTVDWGDGDKGETYDTAVLAAQVFDDLKRQKPRTKRQMVETVSRGTFEGMPKYDHQAHSALLRRFNDKLDDPYYQKLARKMHREYSQACDAAAARLVDEFCRRNRGKEVYEFHYEDDGGLAVLEYGGCFENLAHERVSHH